MAQKRMFNLGVVDTDDFLEMPITSRLLYYELGMRADDDGFVDNWKKILLFTGLKVDDLKMLIFKSFIIPFENGVIVIKHWRMNNYLKNDRKKDTKYQEELKLLDISNSGEYFLKQKPINKGLDEFCIQNASTLRPQYSIDKIRLDKNSIYIVEQKKQKERDKKLLDDIYAIIDYLNLTTGSNYRHNTKSTITKIKARLNEGFSVEDFKKVINNKSQEWLGTEWENYLRPETLFGTKFEQYLNQKSFNKKEKQLTQREKDDLFLKKIKEELKNE